MPRADSTLIFDDIERDEPGLHVLLIGVSRYPYLAGGGRTVAQTFGLGPLGQLSSPACTVRDVATLLLNERNDLQPRLKTLRVVASASDAEADLLVPCVDPKTNAASERKLRDLPGATLANVQAAAQGWRDDASRNRQDATLFYFAGHGIQRSRGDAVLLLEDVLAGPTALDRAININNIYNGMGNPSLPKIAQTQIYVVDACRTSVGSLKNSLTQETAPVFDVEVDGVDDRVAPILMAAGSGRMAYGRAGETSFFGKNFIKCLSGGAAECIVEKGEATWVATVGVLLSALSELIEAEKEGDRGIPRSIDPAKWTASLGTVLRRYNGPPLVDCTFQVDPDAAVKQAVLSLSDACDEPSYAFPHPLDPHPHRCQVQAGRYRAAAKVVCNNGDPPPFKHKPEFIDVRPPRFNHVFWMKEPSREQALELTEKAIEHFQIAKAGEKEQLFPAELKGSNSP